MPVYEVHVCTSTVYRYIVKAEDEDEAERIAKQLFNDDNTKTFRAIDGEFTANVFYELEGDWIEVDNK